MKNKTQEQYYLKNRKEILEQKKKYYEKNKVRLQKYGRDYYYRRKNETKN